MNTSLPNYYTSLSIFQSSYYSLTQVLQNFRMDLTKKPNTIVNARLGTDTGYYYIDMSITPYSKNNSNNNTILF